MARIVSQQRAIALALTGYMLWVLCDVGLKLAGASRLPALESIALVGFASALLVCMSAAASGELRTLWPKKPLFQAVRAMLDLGNNLCVLIALQHVSLSLFYVLVFLSPLVSVLIARLLLREPLTWKQAMALIVGFAGVVIAVTPEGSARQGDRTGYVACMVCVACFSANMVWSRRMTQTESTKSMAFFSGLVIALLAGVGAAYHLEPIPLRMGGTIAAIALSGVLGNICIFYAIRSVNTACVLQYHYSQLPFGALIGFAVWHERPTPAMVLGAVLIVLAGAYAASFAHPQKPVGDPSG